jgi:DNA-binding NarL/FixJ family response regulator
VNVRVLIADDQAPFRRAARAVVAAVAAFELAGEAMSGEEAVALAATLEPDLVLMDILMPGIGGIEATRRIAEARPQTVTILVSTHREDDLPPAFASCGGSGYLHKGDFGPRALVALWEANGQSSRSPR